MIIITKRACAGGNQVNYSFITTFRVELLKVIPANVVIKKS